MEFGRIGLGGGKDGTMDNLAKVNGSGGGNGVKVLIEAAKNTGSREDEKI